MRKMTRNTFIKGMNKDKSRALFAGDEYINATNARISADDTGESAGSLFSARGNKSDFTFPAPGDTWKLEISTIFKGANLDGTSRTLSLTINGQVLSIPYMAIDTLTFYSSIGTFINGGAFTSSPFLKAQSTAAGMVVYATDYSNNTLSSTTSDLTLTKITGNSAQSLEIVGSTTVRDSSIIFTASRNSTGSGQIWEVTWDSLDVHTLKLIRNVDDAFSINFPIEAEARYESSEIRRVYWTDNNESVRSLNIDSPTAYLDTADILPSVEFDTPYPLSIKQTGGVLKCGLYAVAYRLKSLGGAVTAFSKLSSMVRITDGNDELIEFHDIQGNALGHSSTKSLAFRIDSIDPTYTTMDTVVCSYTSTGKKFYFLDENVALAGSAYVDIEFSDVDTAKEIPEAGVLIPPASFSKAKTITVKDNRLLVGNISDIDLSVDSFDATAYRFTSTGTNDNYHATPNKYNKYNKDSTRSNISATQQKYQAGGGANPKLGGTGANISFEFVTTKVELDGLGSTTHTPLGTIPPKTGNNRTFVSGYPSGLTTLPLGGKNLPMGNLSQSYRNPLFESAFKGYMRSEVYRFAIVFFDGRGRASVAKWIADIRMPDHYDMPHVYRDQYGFFGLALGLKFEVDIPADIKKIYSSYSIVRCPRKDDDMSLVLQGGLGNLENMGFVVEEGGPFVSHLTRVDRLFAYGEHSINMRYHTLSSPDRKLATIGSPTGTKIRPIAALTVTHKALFGCDEEHYHDAQGNLTGNVALMLVDHGVMAKYYTPNYFGDNAGGDDIGTLSANVKYGQNIDTAEESSTFVFTREGMDGGIINYQQRIYGTGHELYGDDIKFRSRGNDTLVLNTESAYSMYTSGSRVLSTTSLAIPLSNGTSNWRGTSSPGGPARGENVEGNAGFSVNNIGEFGKKLLCNLYRELPGQYGGDNLADIEESQYITTNHFQAIDKTGADTYTSTVYGGDIYISLYDEINAESNADLHSNPIYVEANENRVVGHWLPVETVSNITLRNSRHLDNAGNSVPGTGSDLYSTRPAEIYSYFNYQHKAHDAETFQAISSFRNNINEFDNRVHASGVKINGEPGDSWTVFDPLEFIDVDGNHGSINKLITFNDEVLYFQNSAYGKIAINPRVTVSGSDGVPTQLGTGEVLHDFTYKSTSIGCMHQWSVTQSPHGVYWFNILNKKIYRDTTASAAVELSDSKGMHSFFTSNIDGALLNLDNPLNRTGIHGTFDVLNQEIVFTFLGQHATKSDFTIAYSEPLGAWSSFFNFTPTHYVQNKSKMLSQSIIPSGAGHDYTLAVGAVYEHNTGKYLQFYDTYFDFSVVVVTSPEAEQTKVFDNISYHANAKNASGYSVDQTGFDLLECYTDYQHSGTISLTPGVNTKRKEREWSLGVPRNIMKENGTDLDIFDSNNYDTTKLFKDRMRDKYLVQSYKYTGNDNTDQFVLNYINTYYRTSPR